MATERFDNPPTPETQDCGTLNIFILKLYSKELEENTKSNAQLLRYLSQLTETKADVLVKRLKSMLGGGLLTPPSHASSQYPCKTAGG
jgi:hypothetical protein